MTVFQRKNAKISASTLVPAAIAMRRTATNVDYADMLPHMFKMNAGYFLIQLASEKDKEYVYKLIGEHSRDDANGVSRSALSA